MISIPKHRWAGPLPPSDVRLWSKKHSPSRLLEGRRAGGWGTALPRGHLCFWPFHFEKGFHEHQEINSFPTSKAFPTATERKALYSPGRRSTMFCICCCLVGSPVKLQACSWVITGGPAPPHPPFQESATFHEADPSAPRVSGSHSS